MHRLQDWGGGTDVALRLGRCTMCALHSARASPLRQAPVQNSRGQTGIHAHVLDKLPHGTILCHTRPDTSHVIFLIVCSPPSPSVGRHLPHSSLQTPSSPLGPHGSLSGPGRSGGVVSGPPGPRRASHCVVSACRWTAPVFSLSDCARVHALHLIKMAGSGDVGTSLWIRSLG